MIRILFTLFQAPGIITHELSHALFCFLSGVKIYKLRLLRFRDPPGFVEHAEPEDFLSLTLIAVGPFLMNSLAALMCAVQSTSRATMLGIFAYLYLSVVLGMHALPSDGDIDLVLSVWRERVAHSWLLLLFIPFIPILYILKIVKRLHGRIVYAALLTIAGAWLLKFHP